MTFDLERALRKKGEVESARMDAFQFGLRARTVRLLAERVATDFGCIVDDVASATRVASQDDQAILCDLRAAIGQTIADEDWNGRVAHARTIAREQLLAERGNPAPHRLA